MNIIRNSYRLSILYFVVGRTRARNILGLRNPATQ
jgi:hypothetical protein